MRAEGVIEANPEAFFRYCGDRFGICSCRFDEHAGQARERKDRSWCRQKRAAPNFFDFLSHPGFSDENKNFVSLLDRKRRLVPDLVGKGKTRNAFVLQAKTGTDGGR